MVRDVLDERAVSALMGGMGVGHGSLCSNISSVWANRWLGCGSEISHSWFKCTCRGSAFLCQLSLRYHLRACTCSLPSTLKQAADRACLSRTAISPIRIISDTTLIPMVIGTSTRILIQSLCSTCSPITCRRPENSASTKTMFFELLVKS